MLEWYARHMPEPGEAVAEGDGPLPRPAATSGSTPNP